MFKLELERIIEEIKNKDSRLVLVQLPDGLKPKAKEIVDNIEKDTSANAIIWFGSCFGACDIPMGLDPLGIDLVVAFGHTQYRKEVSW